MNNRNDLDRAPLYSVRNDVWRNNQFPRARDPALTPISGCRDARQFPIRFVRLRPQNRAETPDRAAPWESSGQSFTAQLGQRLPHRRFSNELAALSLAQPLPDMLDLPPMRFDICRQRLIHHVTPVPIQNLRDRIQRLARPRLDPDFKVSFGM